MNSGVEQQHTIDVFSGSSGSDHRVRQHLYEKQATTPWTEPIIIICEL